MRKCHWRLATLPSAYSFHGKCQKRATRLALSIVLEEDCSKPPNEKQMMKQTRIKADW